MTSLVSERAEVWLISQSGAKQSSFQVQILSVPSQLQKRFFWRLTTENLQQAVCTCSVCLYTLWRQTRHLA